MLAYAKDVEISVARLRRTAAVDSGAPQPAHQRNRSRSRLHCGHAATWWWALLAAISLGCGGSEMGLAPVEGVVTLDGKPVADAGIMFVPTDPKAGPPAMGVTDADGKYVMMTTNQEGALIGEHRVSVSKSVETLTPVKGSRALKYSVKRFLPEKYESAETSGLTATVVDDDNYVDLKLSSK